MELAAVTGFHMWATFTIILLALVAYIYEKWSMELTSLGTICVILVFFHFFPAPPIANGTGSLSSARILEGFASPALVAVLSLLVMGQGLIRTGILDRGAEWLLDHIRSRIPVFIAILLAFVIVAVTSGFLNNTPVVVIFIPIMQAMAHRYRVSPSAVMMPLSFAAILGGMTTMIGSSTNLLVNSTLADLGHERLTFFEFTVPGIVLAGAGLLYAVFLVPRLLPDRVGITETVLSKGPGKQFIVQIEVESNSKLIGESAPGGHFKALPDMTVRMIQRGERAILPPFEDTKVVMGDVIVVAATRNALKDAIAEHVDLFHPEMEDRTSISAGDTDDGDDEAPWRHGEQVLAEAMIAPASRLVGQTLRLAGFRFKTGCIVLGIQRRARMIRARITEIRLEAGDVLLVQGQRDDIRALRGNRDIVLIESSRENVPNLRHAKRAGMIFLTAVGLAAMGTLPIVVAAFAGAVAMVASGVLNLRQAFRALDPKIVTAIAAALAMSVALQETGGAVFLASLLVDTLAGAGPLVIVSMLFLVAALLTNVISNNAVAVLFTPVAVDLALELGVDPSIFAIAMVFAANCSFASPMGYQTNLLVMGPGHYSFADFMRAGLPLIVIMWLVFTGLAAVYWEL